MDTEKWKKRGLKAFLYGAATYALILINPDPDHVDYEIDKAQIQSNPQVKQEKENKQKPQNNYDSNIIKIMDDIQVNPTTRRQSEDMKTTYLTKLVRASEEDGIIDITLPNLGDLDIQRLIREKITHPSLDTIISIQYHHVSGKFLGEMDDTVRNGRIKPENARILEKFTKTFYKN